MIASIKDDARAHLRESVDRITRCIEDFDTARDHAAVTYEELSNRLTEQNNEAKKQSSKGAVAAWSTFQHVVQIETTLVHR
ncbi:MAG: hypothetical protein ACI9XK_004019 [Granulosicoccus sp.]|jgi:hypothetical protein